MPHGGTIIDFPGQEANEPIFIFVRRYPLAFLPQIGLIIATGLAGVGVIAILGIGNFFSRSEQVLLGSAFIMFMLLFALIEFIDFYFDLDVVTDRRIVDIDQDRLFNRTVSELLLDDIQDVKANSKGILATLFDFGNISIQTAGSLPNFLFHDVKHPKEIAAMIIDLSDQVQRNIALANRHPSGPIAAIIDDRLISHTSDHQNEV